MKKISLVLIVFSLNLLFSQDQSSDNSNYKVDKKIDYEKEKQFIVDTNKTKDYMFNFAKTWIYNNFKKQKAGDANSEAAGSILSFIASGNTYGTSKDKTLNNIEIIEENKEIGRVTFLISGAIINEKMKNFMYDTISFKATLDLKDNKYRLTYSDIQVYDYSVSLNGRNEWNLPQKKIKNSIYDKMQDLLKMVANNFKETLEKNQTENW